MCDHLQLFLNKSFSSQTQHRYTNQIVILQLVEGMVYYKTKFCDIKAQSAAEVEIVATSDARMRIL